MPANKKYLTASPVQRTLKITAGVIGGFMLTTAFHQFVMLFLSKKDVYVTMHFTAYMMWAFLMIVAFLARNGWKVWAWYLLTGAVLFAPYIYRVLVKQ
ncbi:hypothetical protein [Agriterribacter sp.]|uniref:hypothetical protein n=1 Tax=Agriterribacter sp. TaxID=2821509 RepID=UPI002BCEFF3C|nr:hypothetical protein [Agriterribacter sp.]HRP54576.1 hypothetical protein [Agriterribacter sp.]